MQRFAIIVSALLIPALLGCDSGGKGNWSFGSKAPPSDRPQSIPEPIHLLLPASIRLHPFTGTRTFDESSGIRGVDVRIEAMDRLGDATKAFGEFRFEMYQFVPNSQNPKGDLIATWVEDVFPPRKNLLHWDKITRTYEFKLQWDKPIPVGKRFVLLATFNSPFTERMYAERVFVSGQ